MKDLVDLPSTEIKSTDASHPLLKLFSILLSYIFHPVFIPLYVVLFLVYLHPTAFVGFSALAKMQTIVIIFLNLIVYPLVTVVLLKALGFIDSIFLRTQKDRIIPYIASGIFFFWTYTVFKQQNQYPPILTSFLFGIFLASSAALLANIYFKVSMHAIAVGGWLGIFFLLSIQNDMLMTWPICLALLIAGLACSARIYLGSHVPKDIYLGCLIGLLTQWVASNIVL